MGRTGVLLIGGLCAACVWTAIAAALPTGVLGVTGVVALGVICLAFSARGRAAADRILSSPQRGIAVQGTTIAFLTLSTGAAIAVQTLMTPPTQVEVQGASGNGSATPPARADDTLPSTRFDADVASPTPDSPGSPTTPAPVSPPEPAASASAPSAADIALDREYRAALRSPVVVDAYATVASTNRITVAAARDAIARVAEHRQALASEASARIGQGIIGRVRADTAVPTDIGNATLMVTLTVIGCPERGLPDAGLDFLARAALARLPANLPQGIDSFQATVLYEGLACSGGRMPYGASWTRSGNRLSIR